MNKIIISLVIFLALFFCAWLINKNSVKYNEYENQAPIENIPLSTINEVEAETQEPDSQSPTVKKEKQFGPREYVKLRYP
ncbi:hypothetical protein OEV82_14170 [Caldibacillus thermolactis]|jgi:hypothetical protein|uniref:Uncharacterized protein n=1 Tax=Pallidibacillus thermolactis TaxID=251051 RepID=A0ABT2WKT8_9BACI|nr:hypothetical protein [Pallidibacillus thermolactis]MCU9595576.1 hypothetical protein [Pallidibacillus thermolactis]MCU9600952.1 hypothetical protein [Pallidibacillus thermolactis subsp. kokeshiiformis]MED1673922.1 hypothetical protein [Pallidibacillus thermolactis subsp. kokeshiiformis]